MKAKKSRVLTILYFLVIAFCCGLPFSAHAAVDPACNATVSSDMVAHIPVVRFHDSLYALDLRLLSLNLSGKTASFTLAGIHPTSQECAVESVLVMSDASTILSIPSLLWGSNIYSVTLQLVSTRRVSSTSTAADNGLGRSVQATESAYDVELVELLPMKDVWKGTSHCHVEMTAALGSATQLTVWDMTGGATFGRSNDTSDPPGVYQLWNGILTYWATILIDASGYRMTEAGNTYMEMAPPYTQPNRLVVSDEGPGYYWGEGTLPLPAYKMIAAGQPPLTIDMPAGQVVPWLRISQNKFTRLDPETLVGNESSVYTSIANGDSHITCNWFFIYYP